jgi:hypothetical protein
MNKDAFYSWIAENDKYPTHNHKFIVGVYNNYEGVKGLHRYFGPFNTDKDARVFAAEYRDKYTTPGFIVDIRVFPLCEVIDDCC